MACALLLMAVASSQLLAQPAAPVQAVPQGVGASHAAAERVIPPNSRADKKAVPADTVAGMQRDTLLIRFLTDSTHIDMGYDGNSERWDAFVSGYRDHFRGMSRQGLVFDVYAGASPDGSQRRNRRLGQERGEAIGSLIGQIEPLATINIHNEGARWQQLYELIDESEEYWKEEVKAIIGQQPKVDPDGRDHRENVLRRLYDGWVWTKLNRYYFPLLRSGGSAIVSYDASKVVVESSPLVTRGRRPMASLLPMPAIPDTVDMQYTADNVRPGYGRWHLRTNLLYDAALLPNLGIEYGLKPNASVALNVTHNWIRSDRRHRYWRVLSVDLEGRYWLGDRHADRVLRHRGHHIGIYAAIYRYDLEFGGKGQMGDFNIGGGVAYGYSAPIGRRLSLDMSLGLGYVGGKYKKYEPRDDGRYYWLSDETRAWIGPTKAEVTLVWHFSN